MVKAARLLLGNVDLKRLGLDHKVNAGFLKDGHKKKVWAMGAGTVTPFYIF